MKFVGSGANNADLDRFSDSDSEDDIVNQNPDETKKEATRTTKTKRTVGRREEESEAAAGEERR